METRTSGAEGGPGKRARRNPGTAPRPDPYLISYTRDHWVALRRDTRQFLSGPTLDELEAAICADYGRQPVPREIDPLETVEEMSLPPIPALPRPNDYDDKEAIDVCLDTGRLPDKESLSLLLLLRGTFPQWDISYATTPRAWIARRRAQVLCENSPALLAIALVLIERRARWAWTVTGWKCPPWTQGEPGA